MLKKKEKKMFFFFFFVIFFRCFFLLSTAAKKAYSFFFPSELSLSHLLLFRRCNRQREREAEGREALSNTSRNKERDGRKTEPKK